MRILYLPNVYSQQRQKEKPANIYPVRLAMEAEWYRNQGYYVDWNPDKRYPYPEGYFNRIITEPENLPFLTLPRPDRLFTKAKDYTSGNYKYLPGTHILSTSGCSWGKCSFCVENNKPYKVRPVEDVISEIEECKALGFKEVFDDSATFPTGQWLDDFLRMYGRVGNRLPISCNARITSKGGDRFKDLRDCGFRMLLFGIESANQYTLDRINKGVKVEDIIPSIKCASLSGLEPHIAVMFGYPWESDQDAENTLKLVHYLLRKGYAKTAQASLYCPPDNIRNVNQKKYVKQIYNAAYHLDFWFHKIRDIHNLDDLKYLWLQIKKGIQR